MPHAAMFAAASMLLAVGLALVPWTLASGTDGTAALHLHGSAEAAEPAVLDFPGDPRVADAGVPATTPSAVATAAAPAAPPSAAANAAAPAAPPSQRVIAASTSGGIVSRRSSSPAGGGRTGTLLGPRTTEVWNVKKQVRLMWPLRGPITSGFGWRTHPIFGTHEFHTGIDIAGRTGTPIVAAYSGKVLFAGWKSGYGQVVVVYHGHGFETSYAHLSAASVKPGEAVEQGQEVGRTGSTGWSTGPHLFFEVYQDGIPRNPTAFLP
jgi:murein DD-endopeptidase MepM/ murein hydrolase activator NlpD